MPRVSLYEDKYIEADAAAFVEGKTRERRLVDKDMASLIGINPSSYCKRKQNGKLKLSYMELVKVIQKLELTDEEIVKLMRGKIGRRERA